METAERAVRHVRKRDRRINIVLSHRRSLSYITRGRSVDRCARVDTRAGGRHPDHTTLPIKKIFELEKKFEIEIEIRSGRPRSVGRSTREHDRRVCVDRHLLEQWMGGGGRKSWGTFLTTAECFGLILPPRLLWAKKFIYTLAQYQFCYCELTKSLVIELERRERQRKYLGMQTFKEEVSYGAAEAGS